MWQNEMRSFRHCLSTLGQEWREWGWQEKVFLLLTLPVVVASVFPEKEIFRIGLPLSFLDSIGQLPGLSVKLFFFEIYVLLTHILFLPRALRGLTRFRWNVVSALAAVLLLFGLGRLLVELPANKVLALRNGVFLWYLELPLLLALAALSPLVFRRIAQIAIAMVVLLFCYTFIGALTAGGVGVHWIPHIGIYPLLWIGLRSTRPRAWLALGLIAAALGLCAANVFQRTTLVGFLPVLALIFLLTSPKKYPVLLGQLFYALAVSIVFYYYANATKQMVDGDAAHPSLASGIEAPNPFVKSEPDKSGRERFRWSMWEDAYGLFLSHPWSGIGFERQVVERVYRFSDIYVKNDENWLKFPQDMGSNEKNRPPISGPHNSYLNSLTRLGIIGSLLLVLHLAALWIYARRREWACASVVYAGMVYAFFNVGLEGPVYSAVFVILLGGAMLVQNPKKT